MSTIEVLPEELLAAAQPLRRAAEALDDVANSRRALQHLMEASPSARLAEAFRSFLAAWELTVWTLGGNAAEFASTTELTAAYYAQREHAIAEHLLLTTPGGGIPPLRDAVAPVVLPHPVPQVAPSP